LKPHPAFLATWAVFALCGARAAELLPVPAGAAASASPTASVSAADQRPLWELGAGLAALSLPDYRGSDQGRSYVLPVPYLVYRGTWLKADRGGARALLLDTERVKVDLSLAASTPTRSKNNRARQGMPNLPGTAEIGPNLNITLAGSQQNRWRLDARLPLRAAFTLQSSPRFVGATLSPHLNLDLAGVAGGWNVGLLTGPLFANRKYHRQFYDVDGADATPERPAYRAPGGYAGWQALAATSRRFDRLWVGGFLRYDNLSGAAFQNSPLVRRTSVVTLGLGVSWVFTTSSELVSSVD
jgi:MipA family protein